eukprot:249216-Alexandrium_andersonii.AAC.1
MAHPSNNSINARGVQARWRMSTHRQPARLYQTPCSLSRGCFHHATTMGDLYAGRCSKAWLATLILLTNLAPRHTCMPNRTH